MRIPMPVALYLLVCLSCKGKDKPEESAPNCPPAVSRVTKVFRGLCDAMPFAQLKADASADRDELVAQLDTSEELLKTVHTMCPLWLSCRMER